MCARSLTRSATTPNRSASSPTSSESPIRGRKHELDELFAKLEQDREHDDVEEAKLDPATANTLPMTQEPNRTPQTDKTCKPAPSETCNTSCTLSGSICKNKDRICELAKDL